MLDTESLEEIVGYNHRKEEISDIKFSPGNQSRYFVNGWSSNMAMHW